MNLQNRIDLLVQLGHYLQQNTPEWQETILKAGQKNPWFTPEFVQIATNHLVHEFLDKSKLEAWCRHYHLNDSIQPKNVGIVMAGNIPMVGFHDFLTVFISGHHQKIKLSSKDDVLLPHCIQKLISWNKEVSQHVTIAEKLQDCDAFIATGSNNTSLYFEQYFGKYPNIIRKNKTSVAVLNGDESKDELQALSGDIHLYFGLGCRNITKIYVPEGYDFIPLLGAFENYAHLKDHHRYRNNYDYQLSVLLINGIEYMTNGTTLLQQSPGMFSPIGIVHYEYYSNFDTLMDTLSKHEDLQCIAANSATEWGKAQQPGLCDYADGVDTMQFLLTI